MSKEHGGEAPVRFETQSQRRVHERLLQMGRAFFEPPDVPLQVTPRLNPLVVGPTGAGKSYISERVARELQAHFLRATHGDWIPLGSSREYVPTYCEILWAITEKDRVVLFLDEVEKLANDPDSAWARSCATDLWQVIDRAVPTSAVGAYKSFCTERESKPIASPFLRARMRKNLWIIAAGTWQDLHAGPARLGFGGQCREPVSDRAIRDAIRKSRRIPEELLYRFNGDLLVIGYPTAEETQALYDASGLSALAERANVKLDPERHDWSLGGMRTLEELAAELLLRLGGTVHRARGSPLSKML